MSRKEIRELIKIKTNRDCGDNFTILENKDDKVKVKILWAKDEEEILMINQKEL